MSNRNAREAIRALLVAALCLVTNLVVAQSPGPLALPNQPLRTSGAVYDAVVLPDGRRILLGEFKWVNGEATSGRLQRLRADGRLDRAWNPPDIGTFYNVTADDQGNAYVVVAGSNRITKFSHVDGSVVPGFQATAAAIGAIEVRGGFLYASGQWEVPGRGTANLVRLSLGTGAADPTFAPYFDSAGAGAFAFDPQGRVYVRYTAGYKRVSQAGVVDGSWSGAYVGQFDVLAAADDALYVAVSDSQNVWTLRRLRAADGSIDPGFNTTTRGEIRAIYIAAGGSVWIGGGFERVNEAAFDSVGLARLANDGSVDAGSPPCLSGIYAIKAGRTAGTLEVYGVLNTVASEQRLGIAVLDEQGQLLPEIASIENPGNGRVAIRQADGKILVGGYFQMAGSHKTHNVARFHVDGTVDRTFVSRTTTAGHALAVNPLDGSIYVGGFEYRGGNLDKLDPQTGDVIAQWTASVPYPGVDALMASSDGYLYVGGSFASANGAPRRNLRRVSQAGSGMLDSAWLPQPDVNSTRAILEDTQGTLFVGQANTGRVSRYDTASGTRLWDVPTLGSVNDLALVGSHLFISGPVCVPRVTNAPSDQRCGVARLDSSTGAVDPGWQFSPSLQGVGFSGRNLAVTFDGELVAGGYYQDLTGEYLWRANPVGDGSVVAGWRPTTEKWFYGILADAPNRVWIAGQYETISGVPRYGAAAVPLDRPDDVVFIDNYE